MTGRRGLMTWGGMGKHWAMPRRGMARPARCAFLSCAGPRISRSRRRAALIAAAGLYTPGWPDGIEVDAIGALYDKTLPLQQAIDLDGPSPDGKGGSLGYEDEGRTGEASDSSSAPSPRISIRKAAA